MGGARRGGMSSTLQGQRGEEESTTRRGGLGEDGKAQRAGESKARSDERSEGVQSRCCEEQSKRRGSQ